jgi:hypothetical protein
MASIPLPHHCIEARQMTEDLTTFMLTSITGIAKEKRKAGTDSEKVIERTKCLLNTTGIEPLGGELRKIGTVTNTVYLRLKGAALVLRAPRRMLQALWARA